MHKRLFKCIEVDLFNFRYLIHDIKKCQYFMTGNHFYPHSYELYLLFTILVKSVALNPFLDHLSPASLMPITAKIRSKS